MKKQRKLRNLPLDLLWLVLVAVIDVMQFIEDEINALSRNFRSYKTRLSNKVSTLVFDALIGSLKLGKIFFEFFKDSAQFFVGDINDFEERQKKQKLLYRIVFWAKYLVLFGIIALMFLVKGFAAKTLVLIISSISLLFLFWFSSYLKITDEL